MIWTVRREWKRGTPAAEIGAKIGVSNSAVCGQARRLGLAPRKGKVRAGQTKPAHQPERKVSDILAAHPKTTPAPAPPATIKNGCAFPLWSTGAAPNYEYCGAERQEGSPYCPEHHRVCYVKPEEVIRADPRW